MNKEFTLRDITDAMHSGVKIVNKHWLYIRYVHFVNGHWKDNDDLYMRDMDLSNPSDWKYFEED